MIKTFILDSALFIKKNTEWDITFVCGYTDQSELISNHGIRFVPIKIKRGFSLTGFFSIVRLKRFFKKEKFDIIQYAALNSACYSSIAGRLAKIPIRIYSQWGIDYPAFKGFKRFVFKTIDRITCKHSTIVQPDSKSNLALGIADKHYTEEKAYVISNGSSCGVNLRRFNCEKRSEWFDEIRNKHGIPNDAFVFGYVGRFLKDKGINELLESAKELLENNTNVYFLLVGSLDLVEGINKQLLNSAKKEPKIIFAGFSLETEKYYAAIDCLVLPSYHEGFPTSLIESQAMGTPVITTKVNGCTDSIIDGKTGFLIAPKNKDELKEKMLELVNNPSTVELMKEDCVTFVRDYYDQDELFQRILDDRKKIIKELIDARD